nr:DCC1-like thiol-disulfide oxidoreductase family protein [uncultured Carboxylicivirga sp.]
MKQTTSYSKPGATIFFDGWCRLCSGVVNLLLKTKPGRKFSYIPIQRIKEYLPEAELQSDTFEGNEIAIISDGKIITGASAVLFILNQMGGIYKVLSFILRILPLWVLQKVYVYIANNRYRWFGRKATCEII